MNIESETQRIQDFVARGNFHAAMNIAISALNAARREQDQAAADHFLSQIAGISAELTRRFGSEASA